MSAAQRVTRAAMREYFPHGGLGRRIVALPAYGCVYVKNLKAGCSTVSLWLHRIHTGDHAFTPETTRHREFGLPRPGQIGWERVERMLSGSAFRFTFVRDPARRAESAYRDKVLGATDDRYRRHVRASLGLDGGGPVSLEMFVTSLEQQEPLDMDAHWRPQHLNLMHPLVTYDLIGRLESFTEDLKRVRVAAGLPDAPVTVRNTSAGPREGMLDSRPDLLRRVREVYALDYALYGY